MNQSDEIDDSTSRFLARPPTESPDILLTNFLCSGQIVLGVSDQTPQQKLKDIIKDKRWTRRMLEDWLKKGPPSRHFSVTPNPEFRAIYLVLLSILEDEGKQDINPHEYSKKNNQAKTEEQVAEEQKKFDESISEHFNTGSTWEKVDMS